MLEGGIDEKDPTVKENTGTRAAASNTPHARECARTFMRTNCVARALPGHFASVIKC